MKTFIMISGVPYDSMKQRPQHIADALVRRGHRVLFIALRDYLEVGKQVLFDALERGTVMDFAGTHSRNLIVMKHLHYREGDVQLGFDKVLNWLEGNMTDPVFYVGYPDAVIYLEGLSDDCPVIYDCMDEWEEFVKDLHYLHIDQSISFLERRMARMSSLVMTSANRLYGKLYPFARQISYVPNAVNALDYHRHPQMPPDLLHVPKPIVFFMGAITTWVDMNLISYLAARRPKYSFVFVGPVSGLERAPQLSNIHYLGKKEYEQLPDYLKNADVAIIPFKVNRLTAAVTPLKFYEYLAAGVPTVTTPFPDLVSFPGSRMARNYEDFLTLVDEIVDMGAELRSEMMKEAQRALSQHGWDVYAEQIESWIDGNGFPAPKEHLVSWVEKYRPYADVPVIANEMIGLLNLLEEYEEACQVAERLSSDYEMDNQQIALAHCKCGNHGEAMAYLQLYVDRQESLFAGYMDRLKLHPDFLKLLEITLLRLCNRHLEAIAALDELIGQQGGLEPQLYAILCELYVELAENDLALDIFSRLVDAGGVDVLELFSAQGLCFLAKTLVERGGYGIAETLIMRLFSYRMEERATQLLGNLYFVRYTFENPVGE